MANENEERLVLSGDARPLENSIKRAIKALDQLSNLTDKNDRELTQLEGTAQRTSSSLSKLAGSFDRSSTASSRSTSNMEKYAAGAARVTTQLERLESAQQRSNKFQLSKMDLPAGLNVGVDSQTKKFTPGDAKNLSTADLQKITAAYDTQRQTLESVARAELRRREATAAATAATQRDTSALKTNAGSLASTRYALYDVATTYGLISTAITGFGVLAVKSAADFESAFTNVERTFEGTEGQLTDLRGGLKDLATEIPLSFSELSEIATLGNQLGIAGQDVESFTGTVARFAAVSGQSVDTVATAFGSLSELLDVSATEFEALGSAIAYLAVSGVATEAEIQAIATQIASYTRLAGYSADQTIGLAGALASLRVPPEQARSAIQSLFAVLNKATAKGGPELQRFADLMGLTAQQATALYNEHPEEFVERFAASLGSLNKQQRTLALDALGLNEKRVSNVLNKLANDTDTLTRNMEGAATSWDQQTELARQYAVILDDLNSKFKILGNAVSLFMAELGAGGAPALGMLVDALTSATVAATDFIGTDLGGFLSRLVTTIAIVVAAVTAYRGAMALATASTFALTFANQQLALMGTAGGLRGLIAALFSLRTQAAGAAASSTAAAGGVRAITAAAVPATGAVSTLRGALLGLGRATIVIGVLVAISEVIFNFNETMQSIVPVVAGVAKFLVSTNAIFNGFVRGIGNALGPLGGILLGVADQLDAANAQAIQGIQLLEQWAGSLATSDVATFAGAAAGAAVGVTEMSTAVDAGTQSMGKLRGGAGGAGREVRKLTDYASDLASVMSRAFDIRFGSQDAIDNVTSSFIDLRARVLDAQIALQKLTADRNVKAYFLSVAEAYGDMLRGDVLRGEIADLNKQIADTQADASTELKGNSKAAIQNRKTITGLVSGYQDYIASLASSGKSQSQIAAAVAKSRAEFIAQAQALGYSNAQLKPYIASFADMATAVARVPRNITVTANTNPAIQALNELQAAAKSLGGQTFPGPKITNPNNAKEVRRMALETAIAVQSAWAQQLKNSGNISGAVKALDSLATMRNNLKTGNYWTGGYTGNGGKFEPKGVVHGGEYVFSKQATSNIGVQNLERAHEAAKAGRPFFAGGFSGPAASGGGNGVSIVEFGPRTLAKMEQWASQGSNFYLDPMGVARLANKGNEQLAYGGVG